MEENKEIQRQILWEKWRDPFGGDEEEAHWPGAFGDFHTDNIIEEANSMDVDENDEGEYNVNDINKAIEEHQRQNLLKQNKKVAMIMTPMGVIPMTEHTRAGDIFNFWTAHTNFRLTQEIVDVIDSIDGVETFDIFTPYRWRISVGKAFYSPSVKQGIMKALDAIPWEKMASNDKKKF